MKREKNIEEMNVSMIVGAIITLLLLLALDVNSKLEFVITFAQDSDIVNLHGWSQGSFSGMSASTVKL